MLLTGERKKYSKRISVANLDAGKVQGNRVDGFAEVIALVRTSGLDRKYV